MLNVRLPIDINVVDADWFGLVQEISRQKELINERISEGSRLTSPHILLFGPNDRRKTDFFYYLARLVHHEEIDHLEELPLVVFHDNISIISCPGLNIDNFSAQIKSSFYTNCFFCIETPRPKYSFLLVLSYDLFRDPRFLELRNVFEYFVWCLGEVRIADIHLGMVVMLDQAEAAIDNRVLKDNLRKALLRFLDTRDDVMLIGLNPVQQENYWQIPNVLANNCTKDIFLFRHQHHELTELHSIIHWAREEGRIFFNGAKLPFLRSEIKIQLREVCRSLSRSILEIQIGAINNWYQNQTTFNQPALDRLVQELGSQFCILGHVNDSLEELLQKISLCIEDKQTNDAGMALELDRCLFDAIFTLIEFYDHDQRQEVSNVLIPQLSACASLSEEISVKNLLSYDRLIRVLNEYKGNIINTRQNLIDKVCRIISLQNQDILISISNAIREEIQCREDISFLAMRYDIHQMLHTETSTLRNITDFITALEEQQWDISFHAIETGSRPVSIFLDNTIAIDFFYRTPGFRISLDAGSYILRFHEYTQRVLDILTIRFQVIFGNKLTTFQNSIFLLVSRVFQETMLLFQSPINMNHIPIIANDCGYVRHKIDGDGSLNHLVFGINRSSAYHILFKHICEHIDHIFSIIDTAFRKEIKQPDFLNYLAQRGVEIDDYYYDLERRRKHTKYLRLFISYCLRPLARVNVAVVRALAYLQDINLHVWKHDHKGILHKYKCPEVSVPNQINRRMDVLLLNEYCLERLDILGYNADSIPSILPPHLSHPVVSFDFLIIFEYLQQCLSLLLDFINRYNTPDTQSEYRMTVLKKILQIFQERNFYRHVSITEDECCIFREAEESFNFFSCLGSRMNAHFYENLFIASTLNDLSEKLASIMIQLNSKLSQSDILTYFTKNFSELERLLADQLRCLLESETRPQKKEHILFSFIKNSWKSNDSEDNLRALIDFLHLNVELSIGIHCTISHFLSSLQEIFYVFLEKQWIHSNNILSNSLINIANQLITSCILYYKNDFHRKLDSFFDALVLESQNNLIFFNSVVLRIRDISIHHFGISGILNTVFDFALNEKIRYKCYRVIRGKPIKNLSTDHLKTEGIIFEHKRNFYICQVQGFTLINCHEHTLFLTDLLNKTSGEVRISKDQQDEFKTIQSIFFIHSDPFGKSLYNERISRENLSKTFIFVQDEAEKSAVRLKLRDEFKENLEHRIFPLFHSDESLASQAEQPDNPQHRVLVSSLLSCFQSNRRSRIEEKQGSEYLLKK